MIYSKYLLQKMVTDIKFLKTKRNQNYNIFTQKMIYKMGKKISAT